jgi:hypothetical protein
MLGKKKKNKKKKTTTYTTTVKKRLFTVYCLDCLVCFDQNLAFFVGKASI